MLAHADSGPVPVGPAGTSKEDVKHQCAGAADGRHAAHYCECGVDWSDRSEITAAPWIKPDADDADGTYTEDDRGNWTKVE